MHLPRDKYIGLAKGVKLHISPSYGKIKCDLTKLNERVSKTTIDFLTRFDGTKTFNQIVSDYILNTKYSDDEIYKNIAWLANMIRQEVVILSDCPRKSKLCIIGNETTYYPSHLQVELTTACNLRCSYCYRDAEPKKQVNILDTRELLEILNELHKNGLESVELTGGEPLLHPDFIKIVEFCNEKFVKIGLLTNGTLINDLILKKLLPYKNKMPIGISLDHFNPSVHDSRRKLKGAFQKTTNAIRLLAKHGFIIRVSMVVDQETWPDIEKTLLFAKELGATLFGYSPVIPLGRGKDNFDLWKIDAKEIIEQEKALQEKYFGFIDILKEDSLFTISMPGGCGAGYRVYTMDPKGHIRPCVSFNDKTAIYGSLANEPPEKIFSNPLAELFHKAQPPTPEICNPCKWTNFCKNCTLRGWIASKWVKQGKCEWLNIPEITEWNNIINKNSHLNNH